MLRQAANKLLINALFYFMECLKYIKYYNTCMSYCLYINISLGPHSSRGRQSSPGGGGRGGLRLCQGQSGQGQLMSRSYSCQGHCSVKVIPVSRS